MDEWGGGREYHDFPSKIFCLTVPKNFADEPFCAVFQKISGSEKVYGKEGRGSIKIFRRNFLSHSAENFRRGILYCYIDIGYRKSLNTREGGGVVSRFSVENFLSHSAEKFRTGSLLCCVSENFR